MYATTYNYNSYLCVVNTVEVAVIGDLIFYTHGKTFNWYVCCACVVRGCNVNAQSLVHHIRRTGHISLCMPTQLHGSLKDTLESISTANTVLIDDLDLFTVHQLDDRWNKITSQVLADLW
jgi:hypothetical protein